MCVCVYRKRTPDTSQTFFFSSQFSLSLFCRCCTLTPIAPLPTLSDAPSSPTLLPPSSRRAAVCLASNPPSPYQQRTSPSFTPSRLHLAALIHALLHTPSPRRASAHLAPHPSPLRPVNAPVCPPRLLPKPLHATENDSDDDDNDALEVEGARRVSRSLHGLPARRPDEQVLSPPCPPSLSLGCRDPPSGPA